MASDTALAHVQEEDVAFNGDLDIAAAVLNSVKDNRLTVDDGNRQALSHDDIEELKKTSDGKAIIEKILANHTGLDEKTEFSKAKYAMRKAKKYLKRFTALPMELGFLIEYVLEKEPSRLLDMREECLGLIGSWSNAHWHDEGETYTSLDKRSIGSGRLLVVDDTGGLTVAALADRMGILRRRQISPQEETTNGATHGEAPQTEPPESFSHDTFQHKDFPTPAQSNTITLIHSAAQPNVSLLKYFGYDTNSPNLEHPLHTHLKCLSWLQLLHPDEDPLHHEPDVVPDDIVRSWKSGKRSSYFKKRRRWQRTKAIGDEARAGSFDGLVIATHMDLVSILSRTLPLLRGGAQVVIYSPTIEPLVRLMDLYSKERRAAFLNHLTQHGKSPDSEDFILDPRLLLAPTLQTSRIRDYQVLPGRTHPLMTSRGGSEGYIFAAQRVIPAKGSIEARGNVAHKRRKMMSIEDE